MHTKTNLKDRVHGAIVGDPANGIAGLQDDLWTNIIPDIRRSHGSWLYDAGSGREFLDFKSFFATSAVSYDHPKLLDKAFMERLAWAGVQKPSLSDMWPLEMAEFVETFRRVAVPEGFCHLFFVEGGALGVENAMKASFDWKVRLNMAKGLIKNDPQEEPRPLGTRVIGFDEGFHGRTGYTLSLTHTADPRKYKYFPKFDWFRVKNPKIRFPLTEESLEEVKRKEDQALAEINAILKEHPHDIAAIIIEPIQAEGGDNHFRPEFLVALRRIADENDIMLIYDEVQTGLGTTGKMWCFQHFPPEATPDMIAFGKKVQLGGMMARSEKLSRVKENTFAPLPESKSRLNSTWGGNLVDMVRSQRILEIIEEENLTENAAAMGEKLLDGIRNLADMFPGLINNPRGRGLLLAFDAATPELQGKIWQALYDEGLLCLICGKLGVRFRPHLDVTEEEIKEGLNRITKALGRLKA
ncbi:MAG: L-lysine 6-transaminase [candidate division WOR-3 bacterium]